MAEELADIHAAESADIGGDIGAAERPERQSLRDTLTSAVSEVREKERSRDDLGKFAKEQDKPVVEKAPAKSSLSPDGETAPVSSGSQAQPDSKPVGPPPGWSQASKDFYNSLPPDHPLRQDVLKREDEVSNGFKSYSEKTKQYDAIEQAVAPHRAKFQQFGLKSDAEAINSLFQWEQSFANPQTRMHAFQSLAQTYGVDLSQFARQSPAPSNGSQEIPDHLRPVLDEVGQLRQQVTGFVTAQQQAEQNRISAELQAFANKDHPHFDKVRIAMGQLMQGGMVAPNDLEGAYQRAIWADPELRETMLREQEEKRQADHTKQQAEAAAKARLAAVSPAPRARQSAVVPQDKGSKGVRGSIMAAVKEVGERDRA